MRERRPFLKRDGQPWWHDEVSEDDSGHPDAPVIDRPVNNRTFLLGLDELYREAMKTHERGELLDCARHVANALDVQPRRVPVEGYYAEEQDLANYFRLMRALQEVPLEQSSAVDTAPEFSRLLEVTSSPIFGPTVRTKLLPSGKDPLSAAMELSALEDVRWTVPTLTTAAASIAAETDDVSLVGLAAIAKDPVVLAALRESVVLYAMGMLMAKEMAPIPPRFTYSWRVDPQLAEAGSRLVDAYAALFGHELPPPTAQYARVFWKAFDRAKIVGRCVRLGQTPGAHPSYYHWAVIQGPDDQLGVREFCDTEIWTTERYRRSNGPANDPPPPARIKGLGLQDL